MEAALVAGGRGASEGAGRSAATDWAGSKGGRGLASLGRQGGGGAELSRAPSMHPLRPALASGPLRDLSS